MLGWLKKKRGGVDALLSDALGGWDLPSFPAVVMSAMRKLRDPNTPLSEVGAEIAADPGVTARVLKIANSSAYGLRRRISSVEHGVSLLGRNEVESLLLAVAVQDRLPTHQGPGFCRRRFWQAAARRAVTARALAAVLHPATRSESFTVALLQDMALPLLAAANSPAYDKVLLQWHTDGGDLCVMERAAFGWDHAEVGAAMCMRWEFPDGLAEAIAVHHADHAGDVELPAVALVSCLTEMNREDEVQQLADAASACCGMTVEQAREIVGAAEAEAEDMARCFGR